jgi:hypothetical protein
MDEIYLKGKGKAKCYFMMMIEMKACFMKNIRKTRKIK